MDMSALYKSTSSSFLYFCAGQVLSDMERTRAVEVFTQILLLTVTFTLLVTIAAAEVTEDEQLHQLLSDLAKEISRLIAQQSGDGNSGPSTDVDASIIGK